MGKIAWNDFQKSCLRHGHSKAPATRVVTRMHEPRVVMAAKKKPCCGWKHIIAGLGIIFLIFLLLVLIGLCVVDWQKTPKANKDGEFRIATKSHVKRVERSRDPKEQTFSSRMRQVVKGCPGKVQIFFMVLLMTLG